MRDGSNLDDRISVSDAAKLFADRDRRKNDDARSAEDRARKAIQYAVKNNQLPSLDGGKTFLLADFVGWARSLNRNGESWDSKFSGFPAHLTISAELTVRRPQFDATFIREIARPTVEAPVEWVEALRKANSRWAESQRENDQLQAEVARLREAAARYEEIRAKSRKAAGARRPRNVEKSE